MARELVTVANSGYPGYDKKKKLVLVCLPHHLISTNNIECKEQISIGYSSENIGDSCSWFDLFYHFADLQTESLFSYSRF